LLRIIRSQENERTIATMNAATQETTAIANIASKA